MSRLSSITMIALEPDIVPACQLSDPLTVNAPVPPSVPPAMVSVLTVETGDRLRRVQTGRVQDYVYSVALGLLALAVWMGWSK